jgi:hypothetical protein
MRKAGVLSILLVVVLLAVAVIAEAQQPKMRKIGWFSALSLASGGRGETLWRELRALGYVEARTSQ